MLKRLNIDADDTAQAMGAMLENPRTIIRPLLSDGERLLQRFKEEDYAAFIK